MQHPVRLCKLHLFSYRLTRCAMQTIDEVTERFERYDYNAAGIAVYNFLWDEVADWFIEASKVRPRRQLPTQRMLHSFAASSLAAPASSDQPGTLKSMCPCSLAP